MLRPAHAQLQKRLAELEQQAARGRAAEAELAAEKHKLGERIKELNCLYSLSELISQKDLALATTLQAVANILPPAWQYPAQTTARITLAGQAYLSSGFSESPWRQSAAIPGTFDALGTVEVFYAGDPPPADEGPFLKEERALIEAVALKLGSFYQQRQAATALKQREAMYRSLVDMMHDIVWTTDRELRLTYLSPSAARNLGFDRDEMLGQPLTHRVVFEERAPLTGMLEAEFARDNQPGVDPDRTLAFACTCLTADGRAICLEDLATFIRDENGRASGLHGVSRNITERQRAAQEREQLIGELQQALREVKTLSGMLPICANCKKIRDDQGYWNQIESYISAHSQALFSHGICPDCAKLLYPGFNLDE